MNKLAVEGTDGDRLHSYKGWALYCKGVLG